MCDPASNKHPTYWISKFVCYEFYGWLMFIQFLQVVFVIYLALFCHTSRLSNSPLEFPLASSFLCQLLMSPCEVRLVSTFCFFALFLCHVSVSPQLSVALSAQSCLHLGCVLFPKSVVSMFVLYPVPVSRSLVLVMVSPLCALPKIP